MGEWNPVLAVVRVTRSGSATCRQINTSREEEEGGGRRGRERVGEGRGEGIWAHMEPHVKGGTKYKTKN